MPKKKIMIADDDRGIVDFLTILLEFEGYEVSSTLVGSTLLNMTTEIPDLLIMDIWMSGIDGRDICKQLKGQATTSHLPILMVSASKDIERSALAAGANVFLAKPFEMDELLQTIRQQLGLDEIITA